MSQKVNKISEKYLKTLFLTLLIVKKEKFIKNGTKFDIKKQINYN